MNHLSPDGSSGSNRQTLTDSFPSGHTTSSGRRPKLCCVCGKDLVGKERLKDHEGKYWCPACAKADVENKQPADCPECHQQLTRGDLVAYEGRHVCKPCAEKLQMAAKRAAARVKAAEEEAQRQHERQRMMAIITITAVAVLGLFGIVYWLVMS
jgi:hypothetical protein